MTAPPRDSGSAGAARAVETVARPSAHAKLWHVTLTVGGEPMESTLVKAALERLSGEQPFLLSGRYGVDRAEVHYWEEAPECADAAALALRLWGEHRASAGLPPSSKSTFCSTLVTTSGLPTGRQPWLTTVRIRVSPLKTTAAAPLS